MHRACKAGCVTLGVYAGLRLGLFAWRQFKQRRLRRMLWEVVPALEATGATFWLDFGTLLGLAQSGDVFEHDNDADLVVLEPDFEQLRVKLAEKLPKGYEVDYIGKCRPLGDGLIQRWLRVYPPGSQRLIWMDLYGGFPKGNTIRINKNADCDLPRSYVLPTTRIQLPAMGRTPEAVQQVQQAAAAVAATGGVDSAADAAGGADSASPAAPTPGAASGDSSNTSAAGAAAVATAAALAAPSAPPAPAAAPGAAAAPSSAPSASPAAPAAAKAAARAASRAAAKAAAFGYYFAPAPCQTEAVLALRYGNDWRTPKYGAKGRDKQEHNKPYLRLIRALGAVGLRL